MSSELSGKVSIITGASSGIGKATAILFARKGVMLTLCDLESLEEVLDQCTQASGGHQERFITVQGDVTEARVRQEIVDKTMEKFGRLDILVPSAGVFAPESDIGTATEAVFDHVFNVNVKSIFFLIQASLPHLEASKGNVVCLSSILGVATSPYLIYPMTKAAVDHMTRCLALDLAPKGIRVNAVKPSYIPTGIGRHIPEFREWVGSALQKREESLHPLGNQLAAPEDIADAICFLASDAAKFITGHCLVVDGGRCQTGPFKIA